MLTCNARNASGTRLDLDTRTTPPQHVCPRCRKKSICPGCHRRVNRLVFLPPGSTIVDRNASRLIHSTTACQRCA